MECEAWCMCVYICDLGDFFCSVVVAILVRSCQSDFRFRACWLYWFVDSDTKDDIKTSNKIMPSLMAPSSERDFLAPRAFILLQDLPDSHNPLDSFSPPNFPSLLDPLSLLYPLSHVGRESLLQPGVLSLKWSISPNGSPNLPLDMIMPVSWMEHTYVCRSPIRLGHRIEGFVLPRIL